MVLLALFESLSWLSSKDRRLSTSEKLPGGQADHHVLSSHFIDRREGITNKDLFKESIIA